jgi:hypothetical protein
MKHQKKTDHQGISWLKEADKLITDPIMKVQFKSVFSNADKIT